jgi:hypothetical protein
MSNLPEELDDGDSKDVEALVNFNQITRSYKPEIPSSFKELSAAQRKMFRRICFFGMT